MADTHRLISLPLQSGETRTKAEMALEAAEARRRSYRAEVTNLTFRVLKTIALADGVFHESERALLEYATRALTVTCPDVEDVATITPEALAASVIGDDPKKQVQLLMLMVHMALCDGEEHPQEFELVKQFAAAFGVEPQQLDGLRARVQKLHKASEAVLESEKPSLARNNSAVVLASADFLPLMMSLCHR